MEKTTIKIRREGEQTIVSNEKGDAFRFNQILGNDTVIAALVFQTLLRRFDEMSNFSDDFELELTLEQRKFD